MAKNNIEIVILSLGAVALVGAAVFKFYPQDSVSNEAELNKARAKFDLTPNSFSRLEKLEGKPAGINAPDIGSNNAQSYDMFVGPWLYVMKDQPTQLVDVFNDSTQIHPPIENRWFFDNKLAAAIEKEDARTQDPDGDGFTLEEEFLGKTDPNNAESHPSLASKLKLAQINAQGFDVVFSMDAEPEFSFRTSGLPKEIRATVKVGQEFGEGNNRFKLLEVVQREFSTRSGEKELEKVAVLEQLNPKFKGEKLELRYGSKHAKRIEERSVELVIDAGSKRGQQFSVEEGAKFSIPGAKKQQLQLRKIDTDQQNVEIVDLQDPANPVINLKK